MFEFTEKYSYPYLTILKKYKGKFNADTLTWSLPETIKSQFMSEKREIDARQAEKVKEVWARSCSRLGYDYVKKDTPEYDKVKELFKTLIKA